MFSLLKKWGVGDLRGDFEENREYGSGRVKRFSGAVAEG